MPYSIVVQALRIIHIEKHPESSPGNPRFDIVDAGQYGGASGASEISHSLSSHDVRRRLTRENIPYSSVERALHELAETGSAQVQLPPRAGPRIIRAWFDTVFNPLIPSLELELRLLGKRQWTFSFAPATFELIRPVRRYLREAAEANLEQVLQLNMALAESIRTHDAAVENLLGSVTALHGALLADSGFTDLCNSLMAPETLLETGIQDLREIFGAYPPSDRFKLIAQNVVNNAGELPSHYATARFWNRNRERLLQSLNLPAVREYCGSAVQVGEHLASVTGTLLHRLKEVRLELSLLHDVPYVIPHRGRLTA